MKTKLYIGSEQAEFNQEINARFAVGDYRDIEAGSNNKSYSLELPLTDLNKRLLKFINEISVKSEANETARLEVDDASIIQGQLQVVRITKTTAVIIINGDDWQDTIKEANLRDLTITGGDYNANDVELSWAGSDETLIFPMINYGALVNGETGSSADHTLPDFLAWWQVKDIIELIFDSWTIDSEFLNSTYGKKLYFSGKEPTLPEEFIDNKGLDVRVNSIYDNKVTQSLSLGTPTAVVLSVTKVDFGNEVTDEGGDFFTDTYTVSEAGTYRVKFTWETYGQGGGPWFLVSESYYLHRILKNGSTVLASDTDTDLIGETAMDANGTIDTGYIYLEEGDTVTVEMYTSAEVTNDSGPNPTDYSIYVNTTTKLELLWSEQNRRPSAGMLVDQEWLPDITQLDFLKGLKHAFNLKFFVDRMRRIIYIEPEPDFITNQAIDITDKIDWTKDIEQEILSPQHKKKTQLMWKKDGADRALELAAEIAGSEINTKMVELNSIYADPGLKQTRNPAFATFAIGRYATINEWANNEMPRIWGDYDEATDNYPPSRLWSHGIKLGTWEGLTSGMSWNFEGSAKTSWPKIAPIDYADLYADYYLEYFRNIDQGKIIKLEMIGDPTWFSQFTTVLNDDRAEAFRAIYTMQKGGEIYNMILNRMTTNGRRAKCEFLLSNKGPIPEFSIIDNLIPSLVRTSDGDNITDSATKTILKITAISGTEITLNYLPENLIDIRVPWYIMSLDDFNYSEPSYSGDYTSQDKINRFDFANKKIWLNDATGFAINENIVLYSPFTNYNFLPGQKLSGIISAGVGWMNYYVSAGPTWYNPNDGKFYMAFSGRTTSNYQVGIAYSADKENWTIGNGGNPIIINSDHADFTTHVIACGNAIDIGNNRIAFTVSGFNGSNRYCHIIQMDKDGGNIQISGSLLTGATWYSNSLGYFDGKYVIISLKTNAGNLETWTVEMWESSNLTSGWSKRCDVYTTEYDGNDSVWLEGHSDTFALFEENGELYMIIAGTQRWTISGIQGNRVMGIMKFDPGSDSWSILNDFAPEFIFPMYFYNISGEDYGWAGGHEGGYVSILKHEGRCFYFCTFLYGGNDYQVAAMELRKTT